jgi:hypothetical protein
VRPKTVLVLFVLVAGLLAFIWFYERDLPSSEERAELERRVLQLESEEITRLTVTWEEERVSLTRARQPTVEAVESVATGAVATDWRIEKPLEARADSSLVEDLLTSLTALEKKRTLADVDASELGLDSPRATLTLHSGENSVTLKVGSEVPSGGSMIVAVEGIDESYVVDDEIWTELTRAPGEWRDRQMFPGRLEDIERATIETRNERVLLARRGEEFWLESPVVDRADGTKTRDLLTAITGLRAESFVDDRNPSLARLGLDPPVGRLEIVLRDQETPVEIIWGAAGEEDAKKFFARVGRQIFETRTDLGDSLSREAEAWRSLKLTSFETYQIDELIVSDEHGEMRLQRSGADWQRGEDKISFTTVSDLLYAIVDLEAVELRSAGAAVGMDSDLEDPILRIFLMGNERRQEVRVFSPIESGVPCRAGDRDVVLIVAASAFEEWRSKIDAVRQAAAIGVEEAPPGATVDVPSD